MSSFGVAQFMWPPIVELMLRHYSLSGTFLLLAGIQLQGMVLGALIRPFPPTKIEEKTKVEISNRNESEGTSAQLKDSEVPLQSLQANNDLHIDKQENVSNNNNIAATKHAKSRSKKLDFTVLHNINFIVYIAAVMIGLTSIDYLYMPKKAVDLGYSPQEAAFLISIGGKLVLGAIVSVQRFVDNYLCARAMNNHYEYHLLLDLLTEQSLIV